MKQSGRSLTKRDMIRMLITLVVGLSLLSLSFRLLPPDHPASIFVYSMILVGMGVSNAGLRAMKSWPGAGLILSAIFFAWTIYFGVKWLEFVGFISVGVALGWLDRV